VGYGWDMEKLSVEKEKRGDKDVTKATEFFQTRIALLPFVS